MKIVKVRLFTLVILLSLALVLASAVVAQTLEKPYAEGMGGQGTGSRQVSGEDDKGYAEGQGADRSGSQIDASGNSRSYAEGQAGKSGSRSVDGNDLRAPEGMFTVLVFSGVSDDGQQGDTDRKEATSIHCTNLSLDPVQVFVQVFQWNGTDVFTGTMTIPAGGTVTFSTQNTTIYFDDIILGGSPGTDAIFQGHGQVLAESRDVICSAQVLDPLNYPPIFITSLEMFQP